MVDYTKLSKNTQIAMDEYGKNGYIHKPYKLGDAVTYMQNGKYKTYGYITEIRNNNQTGEKTFVVSQDNVPGVTGYKDVSHHRFNQGMTTVTTNLTPAQQAQVKHVSVLYQGSMAPFDQGWKQDWLGNNIPFAINSFLGKHNLGVGPQQWGSLNSTLSILNRYSNAKLNLYGHSQGGLNGQWAFAGVKLLGRDNRINSGHFYEAPNANSFLPIPIMSSKIHLYDDVTDPVGLLGNGLGLGTTLPMGNLTLNIPDKFYGFTNQHMLQGYAKGHQIKLGRTLMGSLLGTAGVIESSNFAKTMLTGKKLNDVLTAHLNKYPMTDKAYPFWYERLLKSQAKTGADKAFNRKERMTSQLLSKQLGRLNSLAHGGGGGGASAILVDEVGAYLIGSAITSHASEGQAELKQVVQTGTEKQEQIWHDTLNQARALAPHLSEGEIRDALAAGGATKDTIVNQPVREFEAKAAQIAPIIEQLNTIVTTLKARVENAVDQDSTLGREFGIK